MSQRFLLLQVITPHYHQDWALQNMAELEMLVHTYGGVVMEKSVQHRVKPSPDMYIGAGKVEWVKEMVKKYEIDVVVLNGIVNSGQIFRLEKTLWEVNTRIAVWDRVDLILNIFDQHATSSVAKLQIELARIEHIGPRIYGLGKNRLSRQGGGIGTRGSGETNIEFERRKIKKTKQEIQKQLKQKTAELQRRLDQRKELGIQTVALVGYTSAGKTTLFNALTSKAKKESQELFTTLDTVVGKVKLTKYAPTVLISDTIGFIEDLPPFLVEAFRSTLLESLKSQLLLHVIDSTDSRMDEKIKIVHQILKDLGVQQTPVLIFNKIDAIDQNQMVEITQTYPEEQKIFVSAKTGEGVPKLKKLMNEQFGLNSEY
jgi:GTP-binding protein HflX